tara:strand:+ start:380 stop:598 length:219 start_codon:yes stop_codon:yes gene_type:complete
MVDQLFREIENMIDWFLVSITRNKNKQNLISSELAIFMTNEWILRDLLIFWSFSSYFDIDEFELHMQSLLAD